MARFLSEEWLDSIRIDDARMIESSVDISVIGGPDGDVTWHLTSGSGTLSASLGAAGEADVTLTISYDDAVAVVRGELEPSVAFMQGRMKTAGDPGKLLDVVAATARPEYRTRREALASHTEF